MDNGFKISQGEDSTNVNLLKNMIIHLHKFFMARQEQAPYHLLRW